MIARKISATIIFTGNSGFLKNGILSLSGDGSIIKLTDTGGNLKEESGLEHYNGILCPGFVNAHCHLELSHMLGKIPRNTKLSGFIESIIPGRRAEKMVIQKAIREADQEMRREGIVAVGDICNTEDTFEIKSQSPVYYHSFIEIFGTSVQEAQNIYRQGQNLVHLARQKYLLKASITPHSSYSLGEDLFSIIREGTGINENMFSVHNQESDAENDFIRDASGEIFETFRRIGMDMSLVLPQKKNSLECLLEQLPRKTRNLLVHNLFTTEQDIIDSGAGISDNYFVLCPKSNDYISGIYPGKFLMESFPERVCIGTDSLASNNRLSILDELYTIQNVHPEVSLKELLSFATLNGARALGTEKWCGSFEVGKKPGVILIENADLQNLKLKKESRVKVL